MFFYAIHELSDFINEKYSGLLLLNKSSEISQLTINLLIPQNKQLAAMRSLISNDNEILNIHLQFSKNNLQNLLQIGKELLISLNTLQEGLIQNDKIYKNQKNGRIGLEQTSKDLKLMVEIIKMNRNIDSKKSFEKLIKNEILQINQKIIKIQNSFSGLITQKIIKFDEDKDKNELKIVEKEYEEIIIKAINFLEMNKINLEDCINKLGREPENDLFLEIQKLIYENRIYFIENESKLRGSSLFVEQNVQNTINLYKNEINTYEKLILNINNDILQIFLFFNLNEKIKKKEINEINLELRRYEKLPLYVNFPKKIELQLIERLNQENILYLNIKKKVKEIKLRGNCLSFPNLFLIKSKKILNKLEDMFKVALQLKKKIEILGDIRNLEIKFTDSSKETYNFLNSTNNYLKLENKQETATQIYQSLYMKCCEHIDNLENIQEKLLIYDCFIDLYLPITEKIKKNTDNLNILIEKLLVFLQKGSEENDQSCLEYIGESEKVINETYSHLNKNFLEEKMKEIEIKKEEIDLLHKENKRLMVIIKTLTGVLQNICKDAYVCSAILKKKAQTKLDSLRQLIVNLDALATTLESSDFMNLKSISLIISSAINLNIEDFEQRHQKIEILRKLQKHVSALENLQNQEDLQEKYSRAIKIRLNLEIDLLVFFEKIDSLNDKIQRLRVFFSSKNFEISLFDEIYLSQIFLLKSIFNEIDLISEKVLEINCAKKLFIENILLWKDNLEKKLQFQNKIVDLFYNKLKFLYDLKTQIEDLFREINGIIVQAEKTPHRKKRDTALQEELTQKLEFQIQCMSNLREEAIFSRNFVINFAKNENLGKINGLDLLAENLNELIEQESVLIKAMKTIKEISEEENEVILKENYRNLNEEGLFIENDANWEENAEENLIRFRFKEFTKAKLQAFQNCMEKEKPKIKEFGMRIRRFIQNCLLISN